MRFKPRSLEGSWGGFEEKPKDLWRRTVHASPSTLQNTDKKRPPLVDKNETKQDRVHKNKGAPFFSGFLEKLLSCVLIKDDGLRYHNYHDASEDTARCLRHNSQHKKWTSRYPRFKLSQIYSMKTWLFARRAASKRCSQNDKQNGTSCSTQWLAVGWIPRIDLR